jgi:RNA polymerase sigma factor (sigma-70 family)
VHNSLARAALDAAAAAPDDAATFAEWVRPNWPAMATLARRLAGSGEWEDVLQDSFGAAWRKRGQFDGARGSARNWLLAITADQARKSRRRRVPWLLRDAAEASIERGTEPGGEHGEHALDLAAALGRLTERQRLAVTLHYYVGLPVADAAEVMACAPGTVKSTLSDARSRLRAELGEDYR